MSRPWKVAELHPAAAFPGQAQQTVVGPHQQAAVAGAQCDRAALGAHLGVDDGEVHARRHVRQCVAQHQRTLAHRIAADAVRDVHDREVGIDPADYSVADPDEVVVAAVVGEEGDDHEASSLSACISPSTSWRAAST